MQSNDENNLKDYLSKHVLAQVKRAIDDNEEELNNQHQQKSYRHLVFFKVTHDADK